jgi:hypothetical protein
MSASLQRRTSRGELSSCTLRDCGSSHAGYATRLAQRRRRRQFTGARFSRASIALLRLRPKCGLAAVASRADRARVAAAQWYEQHGYIVEAIRHPRAARDWPRAGRLLAHNHVDLVFDDRLATVRELNAFADDVAAADPALAHILAGRAPSGAGGRTESAGCPEPSGLL